MEVLARYEHLFRWLYFGGTVVPLYCALSLLMEYVFEEIEVRRQREGDTCMARMGPGGAQPTLLTLCLPPAALLPGHAVLPGHPREGDGAAAARAAGDGVVLRCV